MWVYTPRQCLPGLASCHDASLCLLIGVGIILLQMQCLRRWWSSSYRSSSLPRRGSSIVGKAPFRCLRMDKQLLSAPLGRCVQNKAPVAPRLRLSHRTSLPRHMLLVQNLNGLSTSTGCLRNARFNSACRKWTWRCKR
jgi:hypothetical protein